MSAQLIETSDLQANMRTCIQKVATGPEYSKDLSFEEAHAALTLVMQGEADPVQTAVLLIAMRMKREVNEEYMGTLQAIIDHSSTAIAEVDEVIDIADPYDGQVRGLLIAPFLPALLAACGYPSVSHGAQSIGPKFGVTHRQVLHAAGANVDLSPTAAALRLSDENVGWAYVDQSHYCPAMHNLVELRQRIVKRQVLTTVEVLVGPIRGRQKTHLLTGFVHKAYPPIYAHLARYAGFSSAAIVRGVEGGIIPSLQQPAKVHHYHDKGEEQEWQITPQSMGIEQSTRAVPLPKDLPPAVAQSNSSINLDAAAEAAAETGVAALQGTTGPAFDALVYAASIMLTHLKKYDSLADAGQAVREVINSGAAIARFEAGLAD
ncbi:MAG: anthranilate phosphoribosyltransferase [Gammaproteobacteria bacterium]|nr:anthranilate phosphoribosyltransferase [Gammaproteobacteria bacterium]